MKKIKFYFRFILYIFLFFSLSNLAYSRNLDKHYHQDKIFDYFSGIISLYNNEYANSSIHLKRAEGLEEKHSIYSKFYQYSLVNSGKIYEAYKYSKKLEKKKIENLEGNLIIGVYYLKNEKYKEALRYFKKLKNAKEDRTLNNLLSISLENWATFPQVNVNKAVNMNEAIPSRFESVAKIQNAFAHCFYESNITEKKFEELVYDEETDFSRYGFFYADFLHKEGKTNDAINVIDKSLKLNPQNLILNQLKLDIQNKKNTVFSDNFNCKKPSDVSAEILYVIANVFSSQSSYRISNFYLNLAKYLNPDFISFETLYAENFYMIEKLEIAKRIYKKITNAGSVYSWHASKQIAKILLEQNKKDESSRFLKNSFDKIDSPSPNQIYDYANFLKNNDKFKESIEYYTAVLNLINKEHYLYPKATDGRGIAYERTNKWEKAEKDFLNSLKASPDQAYVINYLAYSWIEKGVNVEKSLKMLERANNLRKNDGYIVDSLGWALFKLKRYQESEKYLRLAMILMPSDPIVNDHYGDVLWMTNEKIKARYYWNYVFNLKEVDEKLKKSTKEKLIFGL